MANVDSKPEKNPTPISPKWLASEMEKLQQAGRIDFAGLEAFIEEMDRRGLVSLMTLQTRIGLNISPPLEKDGCILDPVTGEFEDKVAGRTALFTPSEKGIVYVLMRHSPKAIGNSDMLDALNMGHAKDPRIISEFMRSIRKKADSDPPNLFHTRTGSGYFFRRMVVS